MTLNEKYGFKVAEDQFGNPVPENYQDEKEVDLRWRFEAAALEPDVHTMLELGSNWAYYTLLFCAIRRSVGDEHFSAVCIESDPVNVERTKRHIGMNDLAFRTLVTSATVGQRPGTTEFNGRKTWCTRLPLEPFDILHCDIDGSEMGLIAHDHQFFERGLAKYVFLLTHKDAIVNRFPVTTHEYCKAAFLRFPYNLLHEDNSWSICGDSLLIYKRK